jgi:hypothetical protein
MLSFSSLSNKLPICARSGCRTHGHMAPGTHLQPARRSWLPSLPCMQWCMCCLAAGRLHVFWVLAAMPCCHAGAGQPSSATNPGRTCLWPCSGNLHRPGHLPAFTGQVVELTDDNFEDSIQAGFLSKQEYVLRHRYTATNTSAATTMQNATTCSYSCTLEELASGLPRAQRLLRQPTHTQSSRFHRCTFSWASQGVRLVDSACLCISAAGLNHSLWHLTPCLLLRGVMVENALEKVTHLSRSLLLGPALGFLAHQTAPICDSDR